MAWSSHSQAFEGQDSPGRLGNIPLLPEPRLPLAHGQTWLAERH